VVYCSVCNEELSRSSSINAALGHDYALAACEGDAMSAVLTLVCSRDASHIVNVETSDVNVIESVPATAGSDGYVKYEASAEYDGKIFIGTYTVVIPATGYIYNDPEFIWNEDGTVSVFIDCVNDDSMDKTITDVEVTSEYVGIPCKYLTSTVYTATFEFNGKTYTSTYSQELTELVPHTPGTPVIEVITPATCISEGVGALVTYCTVCGDELNRIDGVILDTVDHTPGEAVMERTEIVDEETGVTTYTIERVYYCTVCGEELYRGAWTSGHTHADNDGDGYCDLCDIRACRHCGEFHDTATFVGWWLSFYHDIIYVFRSLMLIFGI